MIHSGPYMGLVDLFVNGKRFYEEHYFISCLSKTFFYLNLVLARSNTRADNLPRTTVH